MRMMTMTKLIVFSLLVMVLLVAGCPQNQPEYNAPQTGGNPSVGAQEEIPLENAPSQEEIAALDSEINELDSLIEDSDSSQLDFLELNESTFQ